MTAMRGFAFSPYQQNSGKIFCAMKWTTPRVHCWIQKWCYKSSVC